MSPATPDELADKIMALIHDGENVAFEFDAGFLIDDYFSGDTITGYLEHGTPDQEEVLQGSCLEVLKAIIGASGVKVL